MQSLAQPNITHKVQRRVREGQVYRSALSYVNDKKNIKILHHQIFFQAQNTPKPIFGRTELRPAPHWGAYHAPQTPNRLPAPHFPAPSTPSASRNRRPMAPRVSGPQHKFLATPVGPRIKKLPARLLAVTVSTLAN